MVYDIQYREVPAKMTIGEYLRMQREARGLSVRELAKLAGVSHAYLSELESGKRGNPTLEWLEKVLKPLNASLADLLTKTDYLDSIQLEGLPLKNLRPIPVISWVMAGRWHEVCDNFQPGYAEEWVQSDVQGPNVFALRVKGDSMEPEFVEGDIIIVNPHVEPKSGDFVIAKNDDTDEAVFKQLKIYGDMMILKPLNPKYPEIVITKEHPYRIIGKVVQKIKKY